MKSVAIPVPGKIVLFFTKILIAKKTERGVGILVS
jgi:hypothetical protein